MPVRSVTTTREPAVSRTDTSSELIVTRSTSPVSSNDERTPSLVRRRLRTELSACAEPLRRSSTPSSVMPTTSAPSSSLTTTPSSTRAEKRTCSFSSFDSKPVPSIRVVVRPRASSERKLPSLSTIVRVLPSASLRLMATPSLLVLSRRRRLPVAPSKWIRSTLFSSLRTRLPRMIRSPGTSVVV